jgi:hypothetical protein
MSSSGTRTRPSAAMRSRISNVCVFAIRPLVLVCVIVGYCGYGTSRLPSVTVDVLRRAPGNLSTVR